ncbi:MAG: ribonuclease HI family protein [Ignavibacteria bacterium]|nr:ribonuclease HI family protein [Ignavibacteria bacterium]
MQTLKVHTDGASRGNPGPSGIGIIIYDENDFILESYNEFIGIATNNQTEYKAILKSLEILKKILHKEEILKVEFYSDSQLLVKQINFDYMVKNPELALMNNRFHVLVKKLGVSYSVNYIPRTKNKAADRLANMAIDKKN